MRKTLLQRRTSIWIPPLRMTLRNLIVFGHNFVVFCLIVLAFGVSWNASTFLLIPGLVIYALNGVWVGLVLGILCTRYRDFPQIIALVVQVSFFVTPVFWKREMLTGWRTIIADVNPFYHYLELVRGPLLGYTPELISYAVAITITFAGWGVAFLVCKRYRSSVPYWL